MTAANGSERTMSHDHGIHEDVPETDYHNDPALSQSSAPTLLDSPAKFAWQREHPKPPTDAMEFGSAWHSRVFGGSAKIVPVDADSWRTTKAKDARTEARANGDIALLTADVTKIDTMVTKLYEHPYINSILTAPGMSELSMWAVDTDLGVPCRGRVDRLTHADDGTPVLIDGKTTVDARPEPDHFGKSVANYGYDIQDWWYRDLYRRITGEDALFLFVVQEKDPPYLCSIVTLDDDAKERGGRLGQDARELFAECTRTGHWPGYPTDLTTLSLPRWAR